jgi:xylan 1,4-beta-xylosidase
MEGEAMVITTPAQPSDDTLGGSSSIHNPVLPGFHPDPSILRVGTDYYLATSTFEWYPGVRLHQSTDLVNWRPLGGALSERRVLDLRGAGDSCGVWAPDLSFVGGLYYLVYTDVASFDSGYWDPQNYVVSAPAPTGPWSDPVVLHGRGFDPSLFHDEDGTTWLLSMVADWRPGRDRFAGIQIQQYDRAAGRLIGRERIIYPGSGAGLAEGPHLYREDGWYYLLVAEGGTSWAHQATVARSRDLLGPYRTDPQGALITSVDRPDLPLQKAGHGSFVQTPDGDWYFAHLVGRPYSPRGACVLGRETAIQPVTWPAGGWPRVQGAIPADVVPAPRDGVAVAVLPGDTGSPDEHDDFDAPALGPNWSTLRRPATPDWVDLTARPSHLRIHGGQSPVGLQRPSLVARRVTSRRCSLEAVLEFRPATYRQLAGVVAYYNTRNWHYAYVTADDDGRSFLEVLSCDAGVRVPYPQCRVALDGVDRLALRVTFDDEALRFAYSLDGLPGDQARWHVLPAELDATVLSDEHAARRTPGEPEVWGFTGAMVGLWVQDIGAEGGYADIDSATYRTWR